MRDETVLDIRDVDLVREGRTILRGVDFTVNEGEHWAVLGPNGAGKSTLLSLLGARVHPTRGSVSVLGHVLGRVDMRGLRADIGHVDPRHHLEAHLTVFEVVLSGLTNTSVLSRRRHPEPDEIERAAMLLGVTGMDRRRELRWSTLSQGERGRALIARALMSRPRLLLLDEPGTGLDLAAREQLLTMMDLLRTEVPGLATVTVTHHLEELPSSTGHCLLMADGAVVSAGAVETVLTSEHVSECFGHPIEVTSADGRWTARAQRTTLVP
ncbi:ABC transporter ATP-binding protein [Gordonia sp. NPDC003376]